MTETGLSTLWVYLSASPLLGLIVTLLAYIVSYRLYEAANRNPLLNPVALAMLILMALLFVTDTPYSTYFEGAQFVHFLLGPATVALAVPLYQQFSKLRALWPVILASILIGVFVATLSAVAIAWLLGGTPETLLSLAPKSVTTPVAMGISETIGGLPSLTAVMVVVTGIIGAVFGTRIFDAMGIEQDDVRGIAMGVAAHGIGTARAFQVSHQMGAFSGLAMALSAMATALLLPWLLGILGLVS